MRHSIIVMGLVLFILFCWVPDIFAKAPDQAATGAIAELKKYFYSKWVVTLSGLIFSVVALAGLFGKMPYMVIGSIIIAIIFYSAGPYIATALFKAVGFSF